MDLVYAWRHEVLPRLTADAVFTGVEWRKHGREWRGPCPLHGGSRDSLAANAETLGWKCHACGRAGGPLEWRNGGEPVRGPRFGELVRELARETGVSLDGPIDFANLFRPHRQQPKQQKPMISSDEAERIWRSLIPVTECVEAATTIDARDETCTASRVAELDLARVVPIGMSLPAWATCCGLRWEEWYRIMIPLFDARGDLRGFKGRPSRPLPAGSKKSASPAGCTLSGLVMADHAGRWLLTHASLPECVPVPYAVRLVEGDYDFIGAACVADPDVEATIGVFGGSWTPDHARRVPDGTRVRVHMDRDDAGRRYEREIDRSFGTRPVRVEVRR